MSSIYGSWWSCTSLFRWLAWRDLAAKNSDPSSFGDHLNRFIRSFPFISGHVASFIVDERQSKAKHLQTIAGLRRAVYWTSNLIWDTVNYQIPFLFTGTFPWLPVYSRARFLALTFTLLLQQVVLMYAFDVDIFTTSAHHTREGVLLLLMLFGPAAAAFSYSFSFVFTSGTLCNIFILTVGFLTGLILPIATYTLRLIGTDSDHPWVRLVHIAKAIEWIGLCFPSFCLGKGLFYIMNIKTFERQASTHLSAFDPEILLCEVMALPLQTVAYLLFTVCLDHLQTNPWELLCRFAKPLLNSNATAYQQCETDEVSTDDDVLAEDDRIQSEGAKDDVVVMRNLSKVFANGKVAVNNLSLGIPEGECFGLLGR